MILTAIILLSSAMAAATQPHPRPIRDLRYGKALYDFYQDQYFRSITDILVAQARSPIANQGDDPELLLGSLYLSYGMGESAADIFEHVLNARQDPYAHALAWFYLGRMRYMDGQYARALEAFRSIAGALPEAKSSERRYFMVNAYLHNQNYAAATKLLNNIKSDEIWDRYARYNLAIALIRAGHTQKGTALLDQINRLPPSTEEELTLRDKANIAIGYASLRNGASPPPVTAFADVRLNGPFSSQALLGIGWAYNVDKQPHEALKPWMELSSRTTTDLTTQEALIAIAYTFEQLKQPRLALNYYGKAVASYDRISTEISKALSGVDYIELLKDSIPPSFAVDEEWSDNGLPTNSFPAVKYLSGLLTSREFKNAYRDYRDLNYLQIQVKKWHEKIPLLRTMLGERRRQYTINVAQVEDSHYAERLSELIRKRAEVADEIADIENHELARRLSTPQERDRLAQLEQVKSRLDYIAAHGLDVDAEIKNYRILYGLTQWNIYTEYPVRLWEVKKGLHQLDKTLAQAAQAETSLGNVLKLTPLNFDGFSRRIVDLNRNLTVISEKLSAAAENQLQYCNQLIIHTLAGKRHQVDLQRNRALYAQARLYDRLSHEAAAP